MVVRTLFLLAVVVTLSNADTFNSYCTIIQGGVVTATNSFSTLLPEGAGAACPDVSFRNAFSDTFFDYTNFRFIAQAIDPEPGGAILYGAVRVDTPISIGAYAQIPPEFAADPAVTVLFGQKLEMSKTQTLTISQPGATSARFATLPELQTRIDGGDSNADIDGIYFRPGSFNSLSTRIAAPRVIEYGVPFAVTVIARLGGDWEATHEFYEPDQWRSVFSGLDLTTDIVELTPVPEPTGFLLSLTALSMAAYAHRKSPRPFRSRRVDLRRHGAEIVQADVS